MVQYRKLRKLIYLFWVVPMAAWAQLLKPGTKAPGWQGYTLDSTSYTPDNIKSTYYLLDFWASWCQPCIVNNRALIDVYDEYSRFGFEIISYSVDKDRELLRKTLKKEKYPWKIQLWGREAFASEPAKTYGVKEVPTSYLIDKEGTIVLSKPRADEVERFLRKKFNNDF